MCEISKINEENANEIWKEKSGLISEIRQYYS